MDHLTINLDDALLSELRNNLKSQRYLKDSWFVAAPLHPYEIRMSHFVCNDLLYDVTRVRTLCSEALPVVTAMDALYIDGAVGEALSDINVLPNAGVTHLALVFKRFLDLGRYKSYLEITSNPSQEFPAISLLKRHGIPGSLLCGFKSTGEGDSVIHFDSFYDLRVIVDSFVGEGVVGQCIEFNYDEHLRKGDGYKCLTNQLSESSLRGSCDFVFCDTRRSAAHHREVCFDEMKTKHVVIAQLLQALNCLSPDGDLVVAVSTLLTRFSVCLVTVLCAVFDEVHLYRPASVAPWTQRLYVVCKRYNDRENSLCRHYLQCVWDAICLHKRNGKEVVHVLLPPYFTHLARQFWEFNTKMLLDEFEDFALHTRGERLGPKREEHVIEYLRRLGVIDALFPARLLESQGPCRLPLFNNVRADYIIYTHNLCADRYSAASCEAAA